MYNFTSTSRSFFLSLLLLIPAIGSMAQSTSRQYANTYDSGFSSSNVVEPSKAADNNIETAARLSPQVTSVFPLLYSTERLRLKFAPMVPQRGQVAVLLKPNGSLDAGAASRIAIRTYKQVGQTVTPGETFSLANLVNVNVGNSSKMAFEFTATQEFNQLEVEVGGAANVSSDFFVYEAYLTQPAAPLPVQLTAFLGKATPTGVALSWETVSEQHNDHFVVERADESPQAFRALSQVQGVGDSHQQHQYQFLDAAPAGLHYYRLRQVDTDGTESFSPVVAVAGGALAISLVAYPTRATHTLTIIGPANAHLAVFNQQGQQVQVADIPASQTQQLDVHGLPDGNYFLRNAATSQSTRFVKASGE